MNNKETQRYVDKIKEIRNKADMFGGCKNRMCITDDRDELLDCLLPNMGMWSRQRLNCKENYQ